MTIGRGGARPNSGPRGDGEEKTTAQQDYDNEKARHEKIKADEREFKLAALKGEYVERSAVQQASATALSVLSQSLRSIPDNIERSHALAPDVIDAIAQMVDAALMEASVAFQAMAPGDE